MSEETNVAELDADLQKVADQLDGLPFFRLRSLLSTLRRSGALAPLLPLLSQPPLAAVVVMTPLKRRLTLTSC